MMDRLAPYMAPGVSLQDAIREAWLASIPDELRPQRHDQRMAGVPSVAADRARQRRDERAAEVSRLRIEGLHVHQIADRIGVSEGTVKRIIREHDIPAPIRTKNTERDEQIVALVRQGLSYSQVAKILGCARTTVSRAWNGRAA